MQKKVLMTGIMYNNNIIIYIIINDNILLKIFAI